MQSEQKQKIATLWAFNLSPKQIAEKLNLSLKEVIEVIKKQSEQG